MLVLIFFLLLVSLLVNILLVWYVRKVMEEVAPLHLRTIEMRDAIDEYAQYVEGVSELPLYYGDQTIKDLVENTKMMVGELEYYKNSFIFESEEEQFEEAETEAQGEE